MVTYGALGHGAVKARMLAARRCRVNSMKAEVKGEEARVRAVVARVVSCKAR
jgi:hypothetical protein